MGLIKTAAKVAVASSVHGRVQRRQQQRWAEQDVQQPQGSSAAVDQGQPVAIPAPAPTGDPMGAQLANRAQLGELKAAGVLTDAEFEAKKAQILGPGGLTAVRDVRLRCRHRPLAVRATGLWLW